MIDKVKTKDAITKMFSGQLQKMSTPIPVTFTIRNCSSYYLIEQFFIKFLHRLSKDLFNRKYTKHKKMIDHISVIEGKKDGSTHYHIHSILDVGLNKNILEMKVDIDHIWNKISKGQTYITDKEINLDYLMKQRSKEYKEIFLDHFTLPHTETA